MRTVQSRQMSYTDVRRTNLEFEEGYLGFLKIAAMKSVLRFRRKGKLSPCFIGPFEILERIGSVAYKLTLPSSLSSVHDVFHVSMLRKDLCYQANLADPTHMIDYRPLEIEKDLCDQEKSIKVLAWEVKALRNRDIGFVKVLWQNHQTEEDTWVYKEKIPQIVLGI